MRSTAITSWDTQASGRTAREQPYPMEAEEAAATLNANMSRPIRSGTGAPLAAHFSIAPTNQTASSATTSSPVNRTARPTSSIPFVILAMLGERADPTAEYSYSNTLARKRVRPPTLP